MTNVERSTARRRPCRRTASTAALCGALLSIGVDAAIAQTRPIALVHAAVIDGTGAPARSDMTIVIQQGRISAMGVGLAPPDGAEIVDLTGKFVTPGIINGHGHVVPADRDEQLKKYASYGVTTTTSMSVDPDDTQQFKDRQQRGDLHGARMYSVMYRFTSAQTKPGSEYPTIEQARAKVDDIVAKGADFVKVWVDSSQGRYPKLTPEYTAAVMDEAKKFGKIRMAHIVELEDARRMVAQGVNILVHDVRDQEIPNDFIETLKVQHVAVISTLAREESVFVYGNLNAPWDNPLFKNALMPDQQTAAAQAKIHDEQARDPRRALWLRQFETDKKNVKKLLDGGVQVGFGTDSGGAHDRFFIPGWSEHEQMELLRDAGLTPLQIIRSFSQTNAEILGLSKDLGTLAPGKAADLLVLPRDPSEDITRMHDIEAVYLGGTRFR
jgi:imidazolonepropionase-like amidohydrolase